MKDVTVKIYALLDPITCKIRYIGRTSNKLTIRLNGHVSKAKYKNTHKDCWISNLIANGKRPIIKELCQIKGWEESYIKEKEVIQKCLNKGFNLVNHDDRGIGGKDKYIDEKQKQKISKTLKRKYASKEILPTRTQPVEIFDDNFNHLKSCSSISEMCKIFNFPTSSIEKIFSHKRKHKNKYKNYYIFYTSNCPYKIG